MESLSRMGVAMTIWEWLGLLILFCLLVERDIMAYIKRKEKEYVHHDW